MTRRWKLAVGLGASHAMAAALGGLIGAAYGSQLDGELDGLHATISQSVTRSAGQLSFRFGTAKQALTVMDALSVASESEVFEGCREIGREQRLAILADELGLDDRANAHRSAADGACVCMGGKVERCRALEARLREVRHQR